VEVEASQDILAMNNIVPSNSVFLHTIPEDCSNVNGDGGADRSESGFGNTSNNSTNNGVSAWSAMRVFRASQNQNVPARPSSVTSSTNAVQAGLASTSSPDNAAFGLGFGLDGSGSNTAVRAGGDGPASTTLGLATMDDYETDPTTNKYQSQSANTNNSMKTKMKRKGSALANFNRKKFRVVCVLTLLLILVVIIALVLIVKSISENNGSNTAESEALNATASENNQAYTLTPSEAVTTMFIEDDDIPAAADAESSVFLRVDDAIYMLYGTRMPSVSEQVFSDSSDPRYQARLWLLTNDTYLETLVAETTASEDREALLKSIAQRYILLVFYFSTTSSSTTGTNAAATRDEYYTQLQPNPDVHECYWLPNACAQDYASTTSDTGAHKSVQGGTTSFVSSVDMTSSIRYLNVSHADLGGTIPFELGDLTDLQELSLHGNRIGGPMFDRLADQWHHLYILDVSENQLTGIIPTSLWTLPTLRFAYLHGNQFVGSIPQTLPSPASQDFEEIWLHHNQLTGMIPTWWAALTHLDVLSISNNTFTGTLPADWTQSNHLAFFDASVNRLTGTVPYSLLHVAPSLRFLYLDSNQLSGTLTTSDDIPKELDFTVTISERSTLPMQAVWLQNNLLSGTVPRGFGWDWDRLRELELYGNQLTGTWDCERDGENTWPLLEEITIDCLKGEDLNQIASDISPVNSERDGGGVDMSYCTACCIKCY